MLISKYLLFVIINLFIINPAIGEAPPPLPPLPLPQAPQPLPPSNQAITEILPSKGSMSSLPSAPDNINKIVAPSSSPSVAASASIPSAPPATPTQEPDKTGLSPIVPNQTLPISSTPLPQQSSAPPSLPPLPPLPKPVQPEQGPEASAVTQTVAPISPSTSGTSLVSGQLPALPQVEVPQIPPTADPTITHNTSQSPNETKEVQKEDRNSGIKAPLVPSVPMMTPELKSNIEDKPLEQRGAQVTSETSKSPTSKATDNAKSSNPTLDTSVKQKQKAEQNSPIKPVIPSQIEQKNNKVDKTKNKVKSEEPLITNKVSTSKTVISKTPQAKAKSENKQESKEVISKNKVEQTKDDLEALPEFTLPDEETTAMLEEFQPEVFPRPTYDYRQNILPPSINKKRYGQDNEHLPKAFYQSEYSRLLFAAVKSDDVASIKALLIRGGNINFRDPNSGYTPTMYAVKVNRMKALRYLITKGSDINSIANDGRTAMHLAAMSRNTEAMKVLMAANADVTITDNNGKRPADYIATAPNNVIIELVGSYSDMNRALLDFTRIGSTLAVQYALNHGANIGILDSDGNTSLIIAVTRRDAKMLSLLIRSRANIDIPNSKGQTPLQIAVENNYSEIADILRTIKVQEDMMQQLTPQMNSTKSNSLNNKKDDILSGYSLKDYPSQKTLSLK